MVVKSNDNQKLKTDLTNLLNGLLEHEPKAEIPNGMTKEEFVSDASKSNCKSLDGILYEI